jgi:polyketide cyclase/dehydrase/lipid transport protein
MKKTLKIIAGLILVVIAFLLIAGIFVGKSVHVERAITINRSPETLWPLISTFENHTRWSPFIKKDPAVNITYEGQSGTVGSVYAWKGNSDVGSGRETMTKLDRPARVESDLKFFEPVEAEARAFITLTPVGAGTKAVWGFDSKYAYPMNVILLFVDFDEMLGKDYNDGLVKLKQLAEKN